MIQPRLTVHVASRLLTDILSSVAEPSKKHFERGLVIISYNFGAISDRGGGG